MNIAGLGAIVTGGGSGLGEATAIRLAKAGAKVAIIDMNAAAAEQVAARIGGLALPGDVTDEATMIAALEQARPPPPHLLLFAASAAAAAAAARDGRREGESDPGGEYGRVKAGTGGVGLASRAAALPWQAPPAVSMSAAPLVCVRVCAHLCVRAFVFAAQRRQGLIARPA